jgi:4-hydroxy-2-oxoheptanedioate aldolase
MKPNLMKAKLNAGETVFGVVVRFPAPAIVEMFGLIGFDYVMLDCEHGSLSLEGCETMLMAAGAAGYSTVLRVPYLHEKEIMRALDIGAQGVQVPMINTRADAESLARAAKYYPLGERGMALPRSGDYGMTLRGPAYYQFANDNTLTLAHIETLEAVENLTELVQVEGIDVFFIGPSDLSQSMGLPGQNDHPAVLTKIEEAIDKIKAGGKIPGIFAGSSASILKYKRMGARVLLTSADALIKTVSQDYLKAVRQ